MMDHNLRNCLFCLATLPDHNDLLLLVKLPVVRLDGEKMHVRPRRLPIRGLIGAGPIHSIIYMH